jgi:asparagine synthase (glutamine-hydrolysing)
MCGIAGTVGAKAADVQAMLDRIQHRGPDGQGVHDHSGVIHGHVRLALVDLSSASAQPFRRDGGTLTFNGEVWNFRELREELRAVGHVFTTTGDTEVLLAMLNRYGLACLPRIDGMFAFAWSSPSGEHWLVRDSFGKIPLYVAKTRAGYSWASERKAFAYSVQPVAVAPGFAFNLKTGKWRRWYSMPSPSACGPSRVLDLLRAGVAKRLDADAPVCCLISGGLDSSIILALAKERRPDVIAFTAVFDPRAEDAQSARKLCADLSVKLIEVPVLLDDAGILSAMRSIEIPSKPQIEIATLCLPLARRVYAEGFRACLSGEASDEIFGGYGNFCIQSSREDEAGVVRLRKELLAKMSRGNFVRCNKAFMAHGVECRLPFMEQQLVEAAIQLGKKDLRPGKVLLKEACKDVLPAWIIKRVKDTFQGGSGLSDEIARRYPSPIKYYNAEIRKLFGYLPEN